jgi:hypothetical protein
MIKCKDYFIIKLRTYADAKLLQLYRGSGSLPAQHHDRAKAYNDFWWKFVEEVTKKDMKFWHREYFLDATDCVKDDLREKFGILINNGEGWTTLLIPKNMPNLMTWVESNTQLPMKLVTKTNIQYWEWTPLNSLRRITAKQLGIDFRKKHNLD